LIVRVGPGIILTVAVEEEEQVPDDPHTLYCEVAVGVTTTEEPPEPVLQV
jgi:hypothetical protein